MANPLENYAAHTNSNELALSSRFENYALDNPKSIKQDTYQDNTYRTERYTMHDGTNYLVTHSELGRRAVRDSSDIMSLETSAWFTKFGGFNERRQRALAEHFGIPSVFIGVQQNAEKIGDIKQHARNMLAIHAHVAIRLGNDPENVILNGVSRGAMSADTAQAIAHEHDTKVIFNDSLVPCMPHGVSIPKFLGGIKDTMPSEFTAVRSLRLPASILLHYRNTVDASLFGLFQQLKETPTLMAGQLGRAVRSNPDKESFFGYQTVYEGDTLSQGERFMKLYKDHPYTKVDLIPKGGHLSCISSEAYFAWKDRMETITNILHEDPSRRLLAARSLYELAVAENPVFEKE
ncbi:MAG: hypothetical protein H6797_03775 [Candidatus Nomurabacteria bacterium]|nr:MAG: hypothetical protein H6797_03775 [Candidatus Nomurabacteria bacterium]